MYASLFEYSVINNQHRKNYAGILEIEEKLY